MKTTKNTHVEDPAIDALRRVLEAKPPAQLLEACQSDDFAAAQEASGLIANALVGNDLAETLVLALAPAQALPGSAREVAELMDEATRLRGEDMSAGERERRVDAWRERYERVSRAIITAPGFDAAGMETLRELCDWGPQWPAGA